MKRFMGKEFLLDTETARQLYHTYAERLPIIDYHCHVSPREIAENRRFSNITELWLGGDHYKWRAMRSCGIDEKYITGDASDYEKFRAFACCMPRLIGNPLYHWSHLELQRYFGYNGALSEKTCDEVWELTSARLSEPYMTVKNIIRASNVDVICTTDDPADELCYHEKIAQDEHFTTRVLPAFRPDKGINIRRSGWREYIAALSEAAGMPITDLESLKAAYSARLDYFAEHGCVTADHGIDDAIPAAERHELARADEIFRAALSGKQPSEHEGGIFALEMHRFFAGEYTRRGWVMQIHFGVMRNPCTPMFERLGPDSGFDIIGGRSSVTELARMLDLFAIENALPRTVIYSVNPADNAAIGTLIGGFQLTDGSGMPRVMQGSAWWFNDNKTGMREQMTSLANLSAFGSFLGMLTDSRSFLSYTRHEYFRRILCSLIGHWIEDGEYPYDTDEFAQLVMDICYNNTKDFFSL